MKAMILAAGLGTRLRPLTNDRPKALVEVGDRTLLEITLTRLHEFGINDVIVNVHHFDEMIVDYLQANKNFGMHIEISREEILLDTGGGLKKATWFFVNDSPQNNIVPGDEPFLLHNVDVISNIDFARMLQFHAENHALATLAIHQRETSRYLLFNAEHRLCGRRVAGQEPEMVRQSSDLQARAFSGIHVISPRLLSMLTEQGVFSIVPAYLRLAAQGEKILGFRADDYYWRDLGTPPSILQATHDLNQKII